MYPYALAAAAALLLAGGAAAQNTQGEAPAASRTQEVGRKAGEIVTQPVRDVGVSKITIPPVLVKAREDPYSLKDLRTCQHLATAVKELNVALGPDFVVGPAKQESRMGKLAEAGGKTAVNSILPFRALVREVSGAAPAQRRLNDAVDAGYARRGFLRGVHATRGCKTAL